MAPTVTTYLLGSKLQETAHAELYRATRSTDQLPVLLKIPRGEHATAAQLARLRHEQSIFESIRAKGIAKSYGLDRVRDTTALVLEDVGERSLDSLVGTGRLNVERFLETAVAMTKIVETVHRKQIIHKDIKPHHFFVAANGQVTLVDFGVATRLTHEDRRAIGVDQIQGSLAYMSPEQTGRMNRVIDRRTDLYSLGVAFYELLTGVLPFRTTDPLELVHSHIARTPTTPHAIAPEVPLVLSDIVMRLLSKMAEDRYQDVAGLRFDLETCLERVRAGEQKPFALGERDFSDELRISQKLYGREAETAALVAALDRVRAGAAELVLVSGYSGIGKSAVVNELRQGIGRGHFVSGKFDPVGRAVPYAPIAHACSELVRSILTESASSLAKWRQQIAEAVGVNGKVIAELVPEIQLVIGEQAEVQALEPSESQNRFDLVFQSFLEVFMSADQPLVFFLDDLQWADAASLRLIRLFVAGRRRGHVLFVGAYRDNEVDPNHSLTLALADLRKAGAAVRDIALKPLALGDVRRLLADTLGGESEAIGDLAALALRKTHGNPFFLSQFLTTLARDGILTFDTEARAWTWDLRQIEEELVTDNVVDFMVNKLKRLSAATQRVLSLAACIGHKFDTEMLAVIADHSQDDIAGLLWEPLREGLVRAGAGREHDGGLGGHVFAHDRVRQAAYTLLGAAEKQAVHVRIGRLLFARPYDRDGEFEIVNHMNLGSALIESRDERVALAGMNLSAAKRARGAAAYAMALELVGACLRLLGEDPWGDSYQTALAAYLVTAECEFLSGRFDAACAALDVAEAHARTNVDRAQALELRLWILTCSNRQRDAVAAGIDAANLLGAGFPAVGEELGPAIGAEIGAIQAALANRSIESLLELPAMTDPEKLALVSLHHRMNPAATQTNPQLMVLNILKAVNLALRHGNSPISPYFYVCYGLVMAVQGKADIAYQVGRMGIKLDLMRDNRAIDAATHMVFAAFVAFWRTSIAESVEYLRRALRMALETGSNIYVGYASAFLTVYRFLKGDGIDDIRGEGLEYNAMLAQMGDAVNPCVITIVCRAVANLRGETPSRTSLDGDGFDSAVADRDVVGSGNPHMISTTHLVRGVVAFLAGDLEGAWQRLATARAVPGNFIGPQIAFYKGLTLAARIAASGATESAQVDELRGIGDQIRGHAATAPATFAHLSALLDAELAAVTDDAAGALTHYDRAIALSVEHESLLHEALANELCGRFLLRWKGPKIARAYLADAHGAYERWGASAKADELAAHAFDTRAPSEVRADQIDALAVVRASQALSTEIVRPRLIQSLMSVVIEQAGAQKGLLLLKRDDGLWVEGMAGTAAEPAGFERFALEAASDGHLLLPRSIIGYVQRTKEKLFLAHAERPSMFSADPYLDRPSAPRSLLCLPMLRQRELIGILYLENSLTGDAFSPDRVGVLEVLAAQAAISLENATLYDELEQRVADRTRELEASMRTIQENQAKILETERRAAIAHYEREMAIARQIQTSILPKTLHVDGFDVAAAMVTATEVGGDYYDVVPARDGGFWLGIGDVSGHGLDAGLMMMMLQSGLAVLMKDERSSDPAKLICQVNRMLYENIRVRLGSDNFATLSLYRFYPDGRFVVAGAHEETLIWRARTGDFTRIPVEGTWVGVIESVEKATQSHEHRLEEGDFLIAYTDGITEARVGKEQFGLDRLERSIGHLHGEPAEKICTTAFRSVMDYAPDPADDQTLLVVRRAAHVTV